MTKDLNFFLASFPCGSGKTYSTIAHAVKLSSVNERVVISQPTIALLNETIGDKRFNLYRKKISIVHGKDGYGRVGERVSECLTNADRGTMLFQTHSSLLNVEYVPPNQSWHLFLDEVPEITYCAQIPVDAKHHAEFLELLSFGKQVGYYAELKPNALIKAVYSNEKRDIYWNNEAIQKLVSRIMSRHWAVYCDLADHKRFVDGKSEWITIYGILKPTVFEGFKSVTILGASIEESLLHKIWSSSQVNFEEHPTIKPSCGKHANSHLLTINYCIEQNFSKNARDKITSFIHEDEQINLIDLMMVLVKAYFPNPKEYLWAANNDIPDNTLPGERISCISHGLNSYQHVTKLAFLTALNETPKFRAFLGDITGISSSEIYNSITLASAYQTIMRTSLRNTESTAPVEVIVPDKRCADLLKESFFPDAKIVNLSGAQLITGKPGRPATGQKEKREYERQRRETKAKELLEQIASINASSGINSLNVLKGINSTPDAISISNQPLDIAVALYPSRARPIPHELATLTHEEFIEFLKLHHADKLPNKEENCLISPAIFDPNKSTKTDRGNENIHHLNGMWLDNDGGDLEPEDFASCFPSWKMYIFNSYSSGKNGEKRWRCYIPITCLITPDVYKHITAQIRTRLANKKYYGKDYIQKNPDAKRHGFDEPKLNAPSALFYMPCQSAFGDSFFHEFDGDGRQFLNPYNYIKQVKVPCEVARAPKPLPEIQSISEKISAIRRKFGDEEIERRIDVFIREAIGKPKGEQRIGLRKLAYQLRAYGLDFHDRRRKLEDAADRMISRHERHGEVAEIMREI